MPRGRDRDSRSRAEWWVAAVFALVAAVYVLHLVAPDPSLRWAPADEACCHIWAIQIFQQQGVLDGVRDYPSATTPLYHLLMALVYGRVPDVALRLAWVAVTLAAGWLLYRHLREDDLSLRRRLGALAIAMAFLASPTIRASAVYFVTDGLPLHLAIVSLVLLRRAESRPGSPAWSWAAVLAAWMSFYTRQYYLWVPLYVTYSILRSERGVAVRAAAAAGSAALMLPALGLFGVWGRLTPPMVWAHHTEFAAAVSLPNALAFVAPYTLPALWLAVRDDVRDHFRGERRPGRSRALAVPLGIAGGLALYVAALLAMGFQVPSGGILGRLVEPIFGRYAAVAFLAVSYIGLLALVRWFVTDGARQAWWLVFLAPFVVSGVLLQRYFDPAVMVFLFLVARPADVRRILDSRLVWFYPVFTVAYSVGRALYLD